ncbi:unnamed protein product [Blepharisma stoltei]|uniref:ALA-interacting subunit n=1 Tax=Blepharisma stoltei TaxID=1481888 RepID=A0AAU9J3Q6_9CILI|nr:unnamed protein product [Blepharisma stoltei]
MEEEKTNKPSDSDFKQQRLKAWKLSPSSSVLGIIYLSMGVFFVTFGAVILYESNEVIEVAKRYDNLNECKASWKHPSTCIIEMDISDHMESPIFIYYEIKNMYQNHRKYNKSRDINQLLGYNQTKSDISSYCEPVVTMKDLGLITNLSKEIKIANPCGLIAKSYFNDTFILMPPADSPKNTITVKHDGIAWDVDKDDKFKRNKHWDSVQWTDVEDEHFIVWMSTAGLPTFRKLWGKIEHDLDSGKYRMQITNNYDVSSFSGEKSIIITTSSAFGGKLNFLGILYIVVGCLSFAGAGLIFVTNYYKAKLSSAR